MDYDVVALSSHENFINILDGKRHFYGGNQAWFKDEISKKVGCSIVVAADITCYLSKNRAMKGLYKYEDVNIDNYILHMEEISKYLKVNESFGVISTIYFINKIEEFAADKGIELKSSWISLISKYDNIVEFIKRALIKDIPVAMLMYKNPRLKEYDWHWMTITKIFIIEDKYYIKVATWGECKVFKLEDFYRYSAYGTLVYFNIKD